MRCSYTSRPPGDQGAQQPRGFSIIDFSSDALGLIVRMPTNVRRERVKFVLKDIDLY